MRFNYLLNPVTNNKKCHNFFHFYWINSKKFCLVEECLISHLVDKSSIGLHDSLDPGPEPGADLPDLGRGHVPPHLGDGGPQVIGVGVFGVIDPSQNVSPNGKIQ